MRREVEEIVTRFGVVGLGDVQAAFAGTAAALGRTAAAARATGGDMQAAGDASARAAAAVAQANRALREGVREAEGAGRTQLTDTIRQAQEREAAARKALADAQAAAKRAQTDYRVAPARPRGGQGFGGPADDAVYENKERLKALAGAAREAARIRAAELADVLAANRRQVAEAERTGKELARIARESGAERLKAAEDALRVAREAERAATVRASAPPDYARQAGRAAGRAAPVALDPATAARLRREANVANRAARDAINSALANARTPIGDGPFPAWRQGQEAERKALQDGARAATAAAREKERVAREAEKHVQEAARETARVQAEMAAKAAAAWKAKLDAMASFRKTYLPKLGLLTPLTSGAAGLGSSLVTRGLLPTAWGLGKGAVGMAGGLLGFAGSAVGGAMGVGSMAWQGLTATLGLVGKVGGGILGIGVSAVKAGAHLAYELGSGAVSLLEKLGSTAIGVGEKVAGFAKRLAVRGALVGGVAAVAAARAGQKAVADSSEATKATWDASIDSGAGLFRYQALSAAAKRAGVDQADFTSALQASKAAMADIANNPALLAYFNRLGVGTRTVDGRLRDTQAILSELMPRIRQLNGMEQVDLFSKLFGSYEQAEKIYPMIRGLMNPAVQRAAFARQAALGAVVTPADVIRMRAYKAATSDLEDAWKGLKLTVTRAIFADVVAGMTQVANLIGRNRNAIAGWARAAIETGKILVGVALQGTAAAQAMIDPQAYFGVPWFRFLVDLTMNLRTVGLELYRFGADAAKAFNLPDGSGWFRLLEVGLDKTTSLTLAAIDLGREFGRAYAGIEQQTHQTGTVMVQARQGVMDVAAGVHVLQRAVASTAPFWRELWAAVSGQDAQVTRFTWLLTVKTWAKELWSAIMGRDEQVTRFPGLLAARDAFAALGTVAKETWFAVSGQDSQVTRFPIILTIRDALTGALDWARSFGKEFWATVSGADAPAQPRFPWLFSARAAVLGFVEDAKAAWEDLGRVWDGGSARTGVGQWAAWALTKFKEVKQGVADTVETVKKVWQDVSKLWDHKSRPGEQFNFEWIRKAGDDMRWLAESFEKAWAIFERIYKAFDTILQHFTGGKLNAETLILVGTIATVTGLTRTLMALAGAAGGVWGKLSGGMAATAAAVGGAGIAGAATTAAAAGTTLATGLGAAETALVTSGTAVVAATTKWETFASKLRSVGQFLGRFGGGGALAGIAAGELLQYLAPEEGLLGDAMSIGGGMLSMGATGAWIGSRAGPWGALAGGVAGAAYGAWSGYSARRAHQAQAAQQAPSSSAPEPNIIRADDPRAQFHDVDVEEATRQSMAAAAAREAQAERFAASRWQQSLKRNQADDVRRSDEIMDRIGKPAAPVGPQASLEPQASFIVKTSAGKDLTFKGGFADVAALRDELHGGLYPPQWNTA